MKMTKLTAAVMKTTVPSRSRNRPQKVVLEETSSTTHNHLRQHHRRNPQTRRRRGPLQPLYNCRRSTWSDFSLIRIVDSRFSRARCREAQERRPLRFRSRCGWLTQRHRHVTSCLNSFWWKSCRKPTNAASKSNSRETIAKFSQIASLISISRKFEFSAQFHFTLQMKTNAYLKLLGC